METTSHLPNSPTLTTLDNMASSESSHYLKLEDLHHTSSASSPAPSTFDNTAALSPSSPAPVVITSRPAKKRKSWGQELPEPKTALPPRKRAKTDDEKEQRRIERIKRNRAAAHNSRERKRQETETLAVALARANAELNAYRKLHGPLPASVVLPEVTLCTEDPDTPAPSLTESRGTAGDNAPSPPSPTDTVFPDFVHIKQEPLDTTTSDTVHFPPAFFNHLDPKSSSPNHALSLLDLTQHSAEMLCDLPCRSSSPRRMPNIITTTTTSSPPPPSTTAASWWSTLLLHLWASQLQTCYRTLMVALWAISPSRMARMMQASAIRSSRSTSSSTTPRSESRSTPRRLALPSAATGLGVPRSLLQRQLLVEAAAARRREVVRQARRARSAEGQILMALSERREGLLDNRRSTSDTGDEKKGVGREGPSST